MQRGQIFNGENLRKCLKDVFALGIFESMSVNSRPSTKDDTRVDIDLMVKERPVKTADLDLEWQIARTPGGRPGLASWVPGEACWPTSAATLNPFSYCQRICKKLPENHGKDKPGICSHMYAQLENFALQVGV